MKVFAALSLTSIRELPTLLCTYPLQAEPSRMVHSSEYGIKNCPALCES